MCRLDLRGTGSSGGLAIDEYTADGARRLCRGDRLAGGAGVVQRAASACTARPTRGSTRCRSPAERPPALGAICAIYATDDRYTDDVHYMGGALQGDRPRRLRASTWSPMQRAAAGARGLRRRLARRVGARGSTTSTRGCCAGSRSRPTARTGATAPSDPDYGRIACPTMIVGGLGRRLPQQHLPHLRGPALPEARC